MSADERLAAAAEHHVNDAKAFQKCAWCAQPWPCRPWLLGEVERLRGERDALRDALRDACDALGLSVERRDAIFEEAVRRVFGEDS